MAAQITITQPRVLLDDPHACTDSSDVLSVFSALFDALVRRNDSGGYEPALATRWTVSGDARTYRFTLRDGLRFHDGTICDAAAVRFCLERMARPDMGATLGAPGVYAQYLAGMTVEVFSPLDLQVTLAEPIADLFDILVYGHIVSPTAIEAAGDDLPARAVGTGPYRLESYEPGEKLTVRAFSDHYAGPPAYDQITWIRGESAADRLEKLIDGRADVANALDHAAWDASGVTRHDYLAPTAIIFLLNAQRGPGADPRVRLALNLAIDRAALVQEVLHGAGQPLHGFVSPVHVGADPDAPPFARDLTEARRLLAEAGYGDGLTLQLFCPTRLPDEAQELAAAVGRQLAEVGVGFDVHLEADRTRYANQVRLKQIHDLCVFDSSPMSAFRVLHEKIDARVKGSWWEGYENRAIEALIDQARRTVDPAARTALHRQCFRLLQQDPPWLYLYLHRRTIALRGAHPTWRMRPDGVLDVRRLPAELSPAPASPARSR
ncbi:MAG: ABC transporter substrate-binding protein [Elsteraceae bacterium]